MASQICGVYIGEEQIAALNLRPAKKGWAVVAGGMQWIEAPQPDSVAAALKAVLRGVKLKDAELEVALPRRQGLLREVLLPATDPAELAQMAQFEAERHIPFNADRHSTGYHVLSQKGVEGSEVLLAAIDRPFIERCLNAVVSTGVKLGGITLSSLGLFNAVQSERREFLKDKTVVIAALGLEALDVAVVVRGRLVYGRAADLGLRRVLEDWAGRHTKDSEARMGADRLVIASHLIDCENPGADAEPEAAAALSGWLADVGRQLSLTHDYARRNMKAPAVDAILLTGEGAVLRGVAKVVGEGLGTRAETVNPVAGLAGAAEQKFPFGGLEFVIPFGTAIAEAGKAGLYRLDLTPVAHYRRVARQRLMRRLITTSALAVVSIGLSTASYFRLQEINTQAYAAYTRASDQLRPQVKELNEMRRKTQIIQGFTEDPNAALPVLDSVAKSPSVPGKVSLSSVNYTQYKDLSIEGTVLSLEDLNDFVQHLRLSGHFADVSQDSAEPTDSNAIGKPIYAFKLTCILKPKEQAAKSSRSVGSNSSSEGDLP